MEQFGMMIFLENSIGLNSVIRLLAAPISASKLAPPQFIIPVMMQKTPTRINILYPYSAISCQTAEAQDRNAMKNQIR